LTTTLDVSVVGTLAVWAIDDHQYSLNVVPCPTPFPKRLPSLELATGRLDGPDWSVCEAEAFIHPAGIWRELPRAKENSGDVGAQAAQSSPKKHSTSQRTMCHKNPVRWSLFIATQVVGAAVCGLVLFVHLSTESVDAPTFGPHMLALDLVQPLPAHLELPDALFAAKLEALRARRLILDAGPFQGTYALVDWGVSLVRRDDELAVRALVRQGQDFIPHVLHVPFGETTRDVEIYIGLDREALFDTFHSWGPRLERTPISARWDFGRGRVRGEVGGARIDREASLEAVLAAVVSGAPRVSLVLEERPAAVRRVDLENFEPQYQLATFSTEFNTRNRDRATNLKLAARALNGVILLPGQRLSYNGVVGERSEERGFLMAPVIVQGEIVEGLGGGACQVSSTLHAAAVFAGLNVIKRANHSLPSSYIEMGLDAVVAWPNLDLKFENSYDFPVAIKVYLDEDHVRAEIWGAGERRRVVFRREVYLELPFDELVTVDLTLPPGTIKTVRRGKVGYRVLRARMSWENGEEVFERLPLDIYKPVRQLVTIGPETSYPPVPLEGVAGELPPDQLPPDP